MKKRISLLLVCAVLFCLCLSATSYADSPFDNIAPLEVGEEQPAADAPAADEGDSESYEGEYIFDMVGLLTAEQVENLQSAAESVSAQYGCGVYVAILEDYSRHADSIWQCGELVYKQFNLGLGEEKNGILLIMSMADRDYDLTAYGAFSHTSFTDYGKDKLAEYFLDNFRNNDWYGGFADYIDYAGRFMYQAVNDKPVDVNQGGGYVSTGPNMIVVIFVPLIIALIVCSIFKSQMKTARKQTEAMNYISQDGLRLSINSDRFINRTVHREIIQTERSSSGGTSINSGGFSHSSGKF